jgi:hypothetical protein
MNSYDRIASNEIIMNWRETRASQERRTALFNTHIKCENRKNNDLVNR